MIRTDPSPNVDPAYLSNGLIGIRPGANPLAAAPAAVSGYVYPHPVHRVECLSPAPYPLTTDVVIGDVGLLAHPERVRLVRQALDFASGELSTSMDFESGQDARVSISVLQFACRAVPSLLCQEIAMTANRPARIRVLPQTALQGLPGTPHANTAPAGTHGVDAALLMSSSGDMSRLGVATAVVAGGGFQRDGTTPAYVADARPGQAVTLRTVAAMVSRFYHPEPDLQAIRMACWGRMLGFDKLRAQNRERWNSLWKSRVQIAGDAGSQLALDAAFFYLHSSVHPSNRNGMPPFGLSQVEHYYGHSFWDTETWSLLPVLLASPEAARSLLEFRVRGLPAARRAAALYGYRGTQYPWEAAQTDGSEVTPVFADTGWSEQHVVPDVALGFWQYQMATGDGDFLRRGTWPVLKTAAEWIQSRGEFTARGYEIRNIMGPNEGVNNVNNSAYVAVACVTALSAASRCAALVGEKAPEAWGSIAKAIVIPRDPKTGAILTYDGGQRDAFPDLSFLLPFEPTVPPDALQGTFAQFKQRQREYMIGFATAGVAAGAAFMGDRGLARDLFEQCWRPFWMPPFGMVKEAKEQTYGCFLTDFGAMLQAVLFGFTGLRIQDGDWAKYPAVLPQGWERIEVERVWVRGEPKRLIAIHGQKAQLL